MCSQTNGVLSTTGNADTNSSPNQIKLNFELELRTDVFAQQ